MATTTNTKAAARHREDPDACAARRARFEALRARAMEARFETLKARVRAEEAQARLTIRDKVAMALEREGATRVGTERGYLVITNPRKPEEFYFAGEGGSLRVGKTLDASRNMTHAISVILEASGV